MKNMIAEIRKLRGLTQEDVAEMVGLSRPAVSQHEKDNDRNGLNQLKRFADALGCSIGQLAGEIPIEAGSAPSFERERLGACIDALDLHLEKTNREVTPGRRSALIDAIYDWSVEEGIAVADIGPEASIWRLLEPGFK